LTRSPAAPASPLIVILKACRSPGRPQHPPSARPPALRQRPPLGCNRRCPKPHLKSALAVCCRSPR